MSFPTPLFLTLAALAGPIIILYMLRLRRREGKISSTTLVTPDARPRSQHALAEVAL